MYLLCFPRVADAVLEYELQLANCGTVDPGTLQQLSDTLQSAWKDQLAVAFLILLTMVGELLTVDHDAAKEQRQAAGGKLQEHMLSDGGSDVLLDDAYAEA